MGYDRAWHPVLARSEASHPWFRTRARLVAAQISRFAGPSPIILDAGCGTGWTAGEIARLIPSSLVVGTDIFTAEIASRKPAGVLPVRSDLAAPPFSGTFDILLLMDVLEHFEDDTSILSSASSALKPGGLLVTTVPAMPSLWSAYDLSCGHVRRYTAKVLSGLLADCGYQPLFVSHFSSVLAPVLMLHRRLVRGGAPGDESALAELKPGRLPSLIMRFFLSLDEVALAKGLVPADRQLPHGLFAVDPCGAMTYPGSRTGTFPSACRVAVCHKRR